MDGDLVLIDRAERIARVTLNRPRARNALSRSLVGALREALATLARENDLRALILTGAGERAFCAGADLVERTQLSPQDRSAHLTMISDLCDELAAFPTPTVAAIRGYALAGGSELALACDIRVASDDAVFGFPEVTVGIFPGAGGVTRLPRLVGSGVARELLFTGRRIDVTEAHRIGLVDWVVPNGTEAEAAEGIARQISGNAPLAVRALKRALLASEGRPQAEAGPAVMAERRPLDDTADYAEGIAAFAEKRKPRFTGR